MKWEYLENVNDLDKVAEQSHQATVVIFKHSTRCSVSMMAKRVLESNWNHDDVTPYFLDLIAFRNVSNSIAERFGVHHESPQLIVIKDGRVVTHANHHSISADLVA